MPQAKDMIAKMAPYQGWFGAVSVFYGFWELLESVRLFDVYTGPQVGDGKKSLAFALRFRAADRTLTEAETGAARDAAVASAAEAVGAVQR